MSHHCVCSSGDGLTSERANAEAFAVQVAKLGARFKSFKEAMEREVTDFEIIVEATEPRKFFQL